MLAKFALPILLGLPILSNAQALGSAEQIAETARAYTNNLNSLGGGFDLVSYDLRTSQVQGSPMLLSSWSSGEVVLPGSKKAIETPLKYDVYRQQLRVRKPQGDSVVVPMVQVEEFSLATLTPTGAMRKRRFVRYASPSLPLELSGSCAELLADGQHVQLVKFWRRNIIKVPENSTNIALSSSGRAFNTTEKYYLRWVSDGHMVAVRRPKLSSLKDALAGQQAAQEALKNQRKPVGSEADLAASVAAIDGLITN